MFAKAPIICEEGMNQTWPRYGAEPNKSILLNGDQNELKKSSLSQKSTFGNLGRSLIAPTNRMVFIFYQNHFLKVCYDENSVRGFSACRVTKNINHLW